LLVQQVKNLDMYGDLLTKYGSQYSAEEYKQIEAEAEEVFEKMGRAGCFGD